MDMTGTIIEFIILLISHSVIGIYSSKLKYSKKITYIVWGFWIIIQTVLLSVAEFVVFDGKFKFLLGFMPAFIGQYLIFFLTTKGKFAQRIFTMLTYSNLYCIAMSFFTILESTFIELHWIFSVLFLVIILFSIIIYFIGFICPLCRAASKNINKGWIPLIFVNIVFFMTIVLTSIFPVQITSFRETGFFSFLFLSVSIMVVYPVIFSNINHMSEVAEKRAVETQNKLLIAQIKAESDQLLSYSRAKHDHRHHILVMLEFANNNDFESLKDYLSNLVTSETNIIEDIRYCDNMMVNTILSVYGRRAKENGITVNVYARVSHELSILPQDLVIVIANLFENAINATKNLEQNNKHISIFIKENSQRLLIKVENICKEDFDFDETHFGVGIQSVISTTNKYEGMYDFTAKNGTFSAKISLNLM